MSIEVEEMTPASVPKDMRELIAAHEFLRRMGLPGEALIATHMHGPGEGRSPAVRRDATRRAPQKYLLGVQIKVAGHANVVWGVVPTNRTEESFRELWPEVALLWNATCRSEADVWDVKNTHAAKDAFSMYKKLKKMGFPVSL